MRGSLITVVAAALAVLGAGAEDARATTFCVPTFSPACLNADGNVAEADLEKAMNLNASDGVADRIFAAAGTFTETNAFEPSSGFKDPGTIEPSGTDPLTVTGAGRGSTIVTSAGTGNIYLLALGAASGRPITIRDLTLRAPESFQDDAGGIIQMFGDDVLERVDLVSLNDGTDGVSAYGDDNVFRDGAVRAEGITGLIEDGINVTNGGALLTEGVTVDDSSWALQAGTSGTLTARRVTVDGARVYGAIASGGSIFLENSVLTIDDGIGLYLSAGAEDGVLSADHVTIVNSGSGDPALEGKKFSATAGDATMTVSNSILRGFSSGYRTETPFGPGVGVVSLTARYSNLLQSGTDNGGNADFTTGNIDADPLLGADFSLPPGSPSVDAGDPGPGLTTDFLKALRPTDGNGDGVAVRDQGAFEYQRPAPPGGGGANGGGGQGGPADTVAPQTTIKSGPGKKLAEGKARFAFKSSEPGASFRCKLDGKKVSRCKSPRAYSGLKPGRHVFKVWATDAAGNKDPTPAKRRFRVPS